MTLWSLLFVASTALAAIGFVVVAILWLRKLRDTISTALGETAGQQLRSAQMLHDKLSRLQTQQTLYNSRLDDLSAEASQMRKEISRLEGHVRMQDEKPRDPTRLLH